MIGQKVYLNNQYEPSCGQKAAAKIGSNGGNKICHNLAGGRATFLHSYFNARSPKFQSLGPFQRARVSLARPGLFVYGFSGLGPRGRGINFGHTSARAGASDDWLPIC